VLIVDDDEGVRRMLDTSMRKHSFAVWVAAGGREAVDLYQRYRGCIDLILLDVRMPHWDGPRTLAAIREVSPSVRVLFMTGDAGGYTEQNLLDLGATAVIPKPFCLSEVARHVIGPTTTEPK
jgi:CheY-like chemotaxis protein